MFHYLLRNGGLLFPQHFELSLQTFLTGAQVDVVLHDLFEIDSTHLLLFLHVYLFQTCPFVFKSPPLVLFVAGHGPHVAILQGFPHQIRTNSRVDPWADRLSGARRLLTQVVARVLEMVTNGVVTDHLQGV